MAGRALHPQFEERLRWAAGGSLGADALLAAVDWKVSAEGWDDAIGLMPCRELPRMLAADLGLAPDAPEVDRFQSAHVTGLLHGLIADRRADGQAADAAGLEMLEHSLRMRWTEELVHAMGSADRGQAWVEGALARLQRGLQAEAAFFATGRLGAERYFEIAFDKLMWALLPAFGLIWKVRGENAAHTAPALAALTLSLQCFDDAIDVEEDRRTRGADVPSLLGVPALGLESASKELALSGAAYSLDARLPGLSAWLEGRARDLETHALRSATLADRVAGLALVAAAGDSIQNAVVVSPRARSTG